MKQIIFVLLLSHSLLAIASEELLGVTKWTTDTQEYKVYINYNVIDELPTRTIEFRNESNSIVHQEKFMDSFLSAFTLHDMDACLITLWVSGSAHHIRVFKVIDENIHIVLDTGYKNMSKIISNSQCPTLTLDSKQYSWNENIYSIKNNN